MVATKGGIKAVKFIEWREPPAPGRRAPKKSKPHHEKVFDNLRLFPGKSALIYESRKRLGALTVFRKNNPDLEFTTRTENGVVRIYARAKQVVVTIPMETTDND